MRARLALRPPVMDRHIAPTAAPTPHGSAQSPLPPGADSYGNPVIPAWLAQGPNMPAWGRLASATRAIRMGAYPDPGFFWYAALRPPCALPTRPWGQLYPPPEAVAGPFTAPPYHLRLGDDVAPGAPATSATYPDILTSGDQVAAPALSPNEPFTPSTEAVLAAARAAAGSAPRAVAPQIQVAGLTLGTDWTTLALYGVGGVAALILLTRLLRR